MVLAGGVSAVVGLMGGVRKRCWLEVGVVSK